MHASAPPRFAFAALILANLVLAVGPWLVRLAQDVGHIGPVATGFWRLALAVPFLAWLAVRQGRGTPFPGWPLILAVAVAGLLFAADLAAWHEGILRTKLANATLFGNFASFLFAIYGFLLIRSLPRRIQTLALLLAAAGTALLLGRSYELSHVYFTGDLLALFAAFFYALYLIVIDRARRMMAPFPVLAIATAAGALPLLLFALAIGESVVPTDWTPVILLLLSSQLVGQGLLVYAMAYFPPLLVGLCFLIQPIVSALIGWAAYGERLTLGDGIGALLICAALVLIRLPERKLATAAPAAH